MNEDCVGMFATTNNPRTEFVITRYSVVDVSMAGFGRGNSNTNSKMVPVATISSFLSNRCEHLN